MTTFEQLRFFILLFDIGEIISRKEIMEQEFGGDVSLDNYRNWFTKAGYLEWVSSGKYKVIKYPKEGLTSRDLRKEAYPHWRNWYEYRYLKNKKND
jgi:hypothetical protein